MHDLLTVEEDKAAAAQGWVLAHVYDMEVKQWVVRILPATAVPQVVALAKTGNALALKALRILAHGPEGKK